MPGPSLPLDVSAEIDQHPPDQLAGEDLLDGRLYVLRTDRRERRQVVGLQKRVVLAHVWHLGWKKHWAILITIDADRSIATPYYG